MHDKLRYIAVLSYADKDEKWASWLHTKLEQFTIDKDLVGQDTPQGPVPANLRPIFLGDPKLTEGDALEAARTRVLDASRALIVLCSANAAQCEAVCEAVRVFKTRHPDRPIIPVVIDGAAKHGFPAPLRYESQADGTLSDREAAIVGPDLRESADGKSLGLAKVVAGLLGMSNADDIHRRAKRHQHSQRRTRRAFTFAAAAIIMFGGYFGWANLQKKLLLARALEAASKYGHYSVDGRIGPASAHLSSIIAQIAESSATDRRKVRVIRLLNSNKPSEAAALLEQIAKDASARAPSKRIHIAEAFRQYGMIAGLTSPEKARAGYDKALSFNPSDRDSLYWRGRLSLYAGLLSDANSDLQKTPSLATEAKDPQQVFLAHMQLGEIAQMRRNLSEARKHQDQALALAEQQAENTRTAVDWPRYHALSLEKIGDRMKAEGNLNGALESYVKSLSFRQVLHRAAPNDIGKKRELSASNGKVGSIQASLGMDERALQHLEMSVELYKEIAESKNAPAGNAGAHVELARAYALLGRFHSDRGEGRKAMGHFKRSRKIVIQVTEHSERKDWHQLLAAIEAALERLEE